jgi:threonine/homoserine/homoserine lactone efflux protein
MTEKPSDNPFDSMSSRAIGFFMLAAGSVLCYIGVISPLLAMRSGAESVSLWTMASACTPLVLLLGATYAAFGERAERILGHPQRPTKSSWLVCAVLVALGLVLHFWLKQQLAEHGYGS